MKENKMQLIGITDKMELHIHGNSRGEEFYTNIKISKLLCILADYTYELGDEREAEMLTHLESYFYHKSID